MQDASSARELLRASATDADAVRQYLLSIGADELNGLLDGISPRDAKCKAQEQEQDKNRRRFLVQDDWLPLVHLLVQCETTRLRAASRIIQVLRRGAPSELESMQLLTEINLAYASALDELQELKRRAGARAQRAVKRRKLLEELDVVLDIVFSFLSEVVDEARAANAKVLPQLLGLVPYVLGMLAELCGDEERAISENLAKLLELPWKCQTVSSLLDVLVDDSTLMSRESWRQLQENVAHMVMTSPEMPSETMNPIIRACILVANVTGNHQWIGIARYLLRQLPLHLRQEAEFNLQMSFQQSPRIVSLACESIWSSMELEEDDMSMEDASDPAEPPVCSGLDLAPDWRDLFLLLHSLQASKPILHHRTSSSRVATEASVFADIEQLSWWIVKNDLEEFVNTSSPSSADTGSRPATKTVEKHILDRVELLLNFGGKQIHAREWKALLLMDISFFWVEQYSSANHGDKSVSSKPSVALMLLEAIFKTAPETRSELLSSLFECSQKPTQRKIAGETLAQLFISQAATLFPHLNAIQDWLSTQFQRSFDDARDFFIISSRLATVHKDLYNFLMVFLRKLLSTGNRLHQEFAVDMWCTWLDHGLPFNEQQEEEIISALKNSLTVCQDIQAWSFGRLEQVFHLNGAEPDEPTVSLRKTSWEELHRFLFHEIAKFIQRTTSSLTGNRNEDSEDSEDEFGEQDAGLSRFRFCSFDAFYRQNASLDGAAVIGLFFQKLLSCLISFEKAASRSKVSSDGLELEASSEKDGEMKQWLVALVSNWKYLFHWICQDSDDVLNRSSRGRIDKSTWWQLLARIYIASAVCNVTIEMMMGSSSFEGPQCGFRGDDIGISIWSLMEVEFGLHRMVHKIAALCTAEMETSLSKEYLRAASYGLHRVLQPEKLRILNAIKSNLQENKSAAVRTNDRSGGMSFDSMIFALDSCSSTLGGEDRYEAFFPQESAEVGKRLGGATSVLEALLSVYLTIRDHVLKMTKVSTNELTMRDQIVHESDVGNDGSMPLDHRLCFSVYADSISTKFPKSARYLLAPARNAKTIVLLDIKTGQELLEHVCASIGRTLEVMKTTDVHSANDHLGNVLQRLSWSGQCRPAENQQNDHSNKFLRLAHYFLGDVKECTKLDGLTKLGVSCAALTKRLSDIGAQITGRSMSCSEWHALSSIAYGVMCDNVVYNPRLLRLLLRICLPTKLAQQLKTFVMMEPKIEGFVQACGLDMDTVTPNGRDCSQEKHIYRKRREKRRLIPAQRKRLRQGFNARFPYGWKVDSDSDSDASYYSDSYESSCSDSDIDADVSYNNDNAEGDPLTNQERIPHLYSQVSQNAAFLSVLVVLEQSISTLLSAITIKNSDGEPCTFPHHQEILGYIQIHDLVNKAIFKNREFSCGSRKVLLKVLHMIELNLRVGKAGGALRRAGDSDIGLSHDTTTRIFKSSVMSALRSRTWIDIIKDASQDSAIKTRVSATLLKMDIFFLQVPGTAQAWAKQSTLDDDSRERLRTLVASVKERIAPMDQKSLRRGKEKTRQRLLGVIPIVKKRRKRLRSRHPIIDAFLNEENGADAFADLEDFIE